MAGPWLWLRSELRRRWLGFAAIALLVGLGAGFSLTAAVGARRAQSAYQRLSATTLAPDILFDATNASEDAFQRVAARREVLAVTRFVHVPVAPAHVPPGAVSAFIGFDDEFGTRIYRAEPVTGRLARSGRADEVTVNEPLARLAHLHAGSRVPLRGGFDMDKDLGAVTVVGVHRGIFDVGANASNPSLLLNAAFLDRHRDELDLGPAPAGMVRVRPGVDAAKFLPVLLGLLGPDTVAQATKGQDDPAQQGLDVEAIGLGLLAAAAAVATALAGGQALSRQLGPGWVDLPTLRALGLSRRGQVVLGLVPAALVAVAAAAIAVVAAVLASLLLPRGVARRVDPAHGIYVDGPVLVGGAVVVVVALAAAGLLAAWRAGRPQRAGRDPRAPLRALPPAAAVGTRWALASTRAPAGAAARSALAAVAVGAAAVVAVTTFGRSLHALESTPSLHGWTFDAALVAEEPDLGAFQAKLEGLTHDPSVARVGWVSIVTLQVGRLPVEAFALADSSVHPSITSGRAPANDAEITLGTRTMQKLRLDVGDTVQVGADKGKRTVKVVGTAAYPELGNLGDIANGASLSQTAAGAVGAQPLQSVALVRLVSGADPRRVLGRYAPEGVELVKPFQPPRVRNLRGVGAIPAALAAFLAVLAAAGVGHALVMSVRSRRRDLAVLRVLGFRSQQVGGAVAWQSTIVAALGCAIGIPLGIAGGRLAWSIVARSVGVVDRSSVAWLVCLVLLPASVLAANLVAGVPAAVAAHTRPVESLRVE